MTQWCYGLKCLGLALGYTMVILMIPGCVAIPKVQTVVSCNYFVIVILIPGGDPGDKRTRRTVAFGASENSIG